MRRIEERTLQALEWALLGVHAALLIYVQAVGGRFAAFYDSGLVLIVIPLFVAVRGRIWPVFQILTITLLPITIKTVRNLVYEEAAIGPIVSWILYLVLPLAAATRARRVVSRAAAARSPAAISSPGRCC